MFKTQCHCFLCLVQYSGTKRPSRTEEVGPWRLSWVRWLVGGVLRSQRPRPDWHVEREWGTPGIWWLTGRFLHDSEPALDHHSLLLILQMQWSCALVLGHYYISEGFRNLFLLRLTNKLDGVWKEDAYVCGQIVLHLQSFVLKFLLKQIGTGRGYIEHSRDPASLQCLPSGGVKRTAQKEEGEDFNWTTLEITKNKNQWVYSKDIDI